MPTQSSPQQVSWLDANQRVMVAEFARLKQRLGDAGDAQALEEAAQSALAAMPSPAAIDVLADFFGLSAFERDVLLLCAGVEMDARLATLCENASPEPRRPGATFGLALATLAQPHWSALAPASPLRRWRLLELDDAAGLTRAPLRIDERVLHHLAGVSYLDPRLRSLMRPVTPSAFIAGAHRGVCDDVAAALEAATASPALWLTGDDANGQVDVAADVAARLGLVLHVLQADDIPTASAETDALSTLWERETFMLGGTLLVSAGADPLPPAAIRFIERLHSLVFIGAAQPQPLERAAVRLRVDKPDPAEQKRLWQQALGDGAAHLDGALDAIAGQFRLSARTIQAEGASLARALATSDHPGSAMWSACRSIGRSKLDELAQRIDSVADWNDLILPEPQMAALRQIGAHVRNRLKVHVDWGFADKGQRGLGITALFAGESGTGKTMAAEVLAHELQLDLYRIDLSALVSKYIGETEKNLSRVFAAAEDIGAILLFDEADALFGKRSEVKDSHDRYANIEVSYLLQRMESYRGLAILTTNLKAALDPAFQRRIRFVVHFPFPDAAMRKAIWRQAFPARTPCGAIDFDKLARLGVSGGGIRNMAINAAFQAAELNEPVSMAHLLQSAHHEASKRDRPFSDAETKGWT
ncbi:ATP-binding protein [Variovorax humicola]|uniref:ATP-binding protein n=1 Tax=Variovorax humicola TaxID=1769758 RepID=A0ABU8VXI5_9BURK